MKKLLLIVAWMMVIAGPMAFAEGGPKYRVETLRLFDSHDFIRKNEAPDYWALAPYYSPQKPDGSCGPTTLVMIFNALRAHHKLSASDELLSNASLKKKLDVLKFGADPGIRGVSLEGMARSVKKLLEVMGIQGYEVEMVRANLSSSDFSKNVHEVLVQNEKSDSDFLIPLFYQMVFTGDPEGTVGHFSPVASYDEKNRRVLIMDVDREYYEPYWVPEALFVEGMGHPKADSKFPGGFVYLKKR